MAGSLSVNYFYGTQWGHVNITLTSPAGVSVTYGYNLTGQPNGWNNANGYFGANNDGMVQIETDGTAGAYTVVGPDGEPTIVKQIGSFDLSDQQYAAVHQFVNDAMSMGPTNYGGLSVNCWGFTNAALQQIGHSLDQLHPGSYGTTAGSLIWDAQHTGQYPLDPPSPINPGNDPNWTWPPASPNEPGSPNHHIRPHPPLGGKPAAPMKDPLVLDLSGSGIDLAPLDGSTAFFDFTNSGLAQRTGWITAGEGLLVKLDDPSTTTITANELIGAVSGNGFADLRQLDTNHDNTIDASDAAYAKLRVWVDRNMDGVSDSGELFTLPQLGITSISIVPTVVNAQANGNKIIEKATFTVVDPATGQTTTRDIAECDFQTSLVETIYQLPDGFTYSDQSQTLPELIGYGKMPDLSVAMTLDPSLANDVKSLVLNSGNMSAADFDSTFQSIIQKWAGVSTLNPSSRGQYIDARHLGVVLKYFGLESNYYAQTLNARQGATDEDLYRQLIDEMKVRFVSQLPIAYFLNSGGTPGSDSIPLFAFTKIHFDPNTDRISVDLNDLIATLKAYAPTDGSEAGVYWDRTLKIVEGLYVDLTNSNKAELGRLLVSAAESASLAQNIEVMLLSDLGLHVFQGNGISTNISGSAGDDALFGTSQNEYFAGGIGNDVYVFRAGDGQDVIYDNGWNYEVNDKVVFGAGISASDLRLSRVNDDLVITFAGGTDKITIQKQFNSTHYYRIETLNFADGTVLTYQDMLNTVLTGTAANDTLIGDDGNNTISGGVGNDTIDGREGDDTLIGGTGNDNLQGGVGNDTYVFNAGDGQDLIFDNGWQNETADKVVFGAGIVASDLSFARSNDDLIITFAGSTDKLTIQNQFSATHYYRVETLNFADGTVLSYQDMLSGVLTSTSGNDTLIGDEAANTISGGAGNDTLIGREGDDTLIGGTGNDNLQGGVGNDTYVFNAGDGQDVIFDNGWQNETADKVVFGAGLSASNAILYRANNDLIILFSTSADQLTIQNQFENSGNYRVETLNFADGTVIDYPRMLQLIVSTSVTGTSANDTLSGDGGNNIISGGDGNDTIYGLGGDDRLIGGTGNDNLQGGTGNDTYVFNAGDGQDVIYDNGWSYETGDKVIFGAGITAASLTLTHAVNSDLVINFAGSTDQLTIQREFDLSGNYRIESLNFADGTTLTFQQLQMLPQLGTSGNDTINGDDANNTISGLAGNDTIYGGNGDDTITGGTGNDYLQGYAGNDTYIFSQGDGQDTIYDNGWGNEVNDKIAFGAGITADSLIYSRINNDLIITFKNSTDSITIQQQFNANGYGRIEYFTFADGSILSYQNLPSLPQTGTAGSDTLSGDSGNNTILGLAGNDTINGGGGDDIIVGGSGNDTLQGYTGNDTYIFNQGDGQDTIYDNGWDYELNDKIAFGSGITQSDIILTRSGIDMTINVAGSSDQITVQQQFNSNGWGRIEWLTFADGTNWSYTDFSNRIISGTANADVLPGDANNNYIDGMTGNDALSGGLGNDTYIFRRGYGQDTINNTASDGTTATDRVFFGAGIARDQLWFSQSGNDLKISIVGTTDQMTLSSWYSDINNQVDEFDLSDGSVLYKADVQQLVSAMAQYASPTGTSQNLPTNIETALAPTIASSWHQGHQAA